MALHARLAPRDGDIKPCPQCRDKLVFDSRLSVLSVGLTLTRPQSGVHYERAWVCRNHRCDYRELLGDAM